MAKKSRSGLHNKRIVRRGRGTRAATGPKVKGLARLYPKNIWRAATSKRGLRIIGISAAGLLGLMLLTFLWFAKDMPSPNKINARVSAQTTKLYDRSGKTVLTEIYGDKNRSIIEFNQMPKTCKDATVALEDKNFYKQGAFSPMGIVRAFSGVIFKDPTKGGGSTITQQYVKNAFLTGDRTLSRKIKELILAIQIELLYKKDDILKLYLNEIPYGSTAYGLQAAAKTYFGKDAKDLNLPECAMLASMPQAPSYFSPYGQNKDALIRKKNKVLLLMAEQHYITDEQAKAAIEVDVLAQLKPQSLYANVTAPHFIQYVREELEEKYGVKRVNEGGLKVITTLDLDKQKIAEEAIQANMDSVKRYGGSNAALVSADPRNGQILTMVGSADYNNEEFGTFNVATAKRQPGSSFKPIAYATAFKKNWGPGSTLYDVTTDFGGGYKPANYNVRNYGVQSMRSALAGSLNISAVKTLYLAGIPETIKTAKDLGINTLTQSPDDYGLSLVLGSGDVRLNEMVNAYSAFANEGRRANPTFYIKITDSNGKVVDEHKSDEKGKQVIDPQIAYLISNILSDNGARAYIFGSRNPLTLPNRPVAAKTGTTEKYRDAWTLGYTPQLVTGVWAGNNNNKSMTAAAASASAPIWNYYMTRATKNDPVQQFKKPAGIKQVTLDANTGKLPTDTTKQKRTDIFPSWYKPQNPSQTTTGKIDKVSGKLATDCTPADAIQEVTAGQITAEIPKTDPSFARWQAPVAALAVSIGYSSGGNLPTDKDDVHNCSDAKPSVTLIVTPPSGSTFTITANVSSGTFPANKVVFYANGTEITTQNINGSGSYAITNSPSASGDVKYSAKVFDSALYNASSNEVTVEATSSSYSISCASGKCSISPSTDIVLAEMFYNNISQGAKASSPFQWSGYTSGMSVKATINLNGGGSETITY